MDTLNNLDTMGNQRTKINSNFTELDSKMEFGDGTNKTTFASDGTMRRVGSATAWKDMVGDLFGKRLGSTVGKVDYDFDENAMKFQSGGSITNSNDRIGVNNQINHEFKVGSSITFYPHIHWFQENATEFQFTIRYRLQRNGQAKNTGWTTSVVTVNATSNAFTYTSGTINQITAMGSLTVDCSISDTFQMQLARTDSQSGDILVYFADMHGEVDSDGSDGEYTKA